MSKSGPPPAAKASRYPPSVVCAALGIPSGTLGTWAKRGLLANFDAAFAKRGKPRSFTLKDALALALIRKASTNDFVPPAIAHYAPLAAGDWIEAPGRITELTYLYYEGKGQTIRYDDAFMQNPADPGWDVRLSFNIGAIFKKTEALLRCYPGRGCSATRPSRKSKPICSRKASTRRPDGSPPRSPPRPRRGRRTERPPRQRQP
jgi:hypothetical protein